MNHSLKFKYQPGRLKWQNSTKRFSVMPTESHVSVTDTAVQPAVDT
jgi:hypothetical protein